MLPSAKILSWTSPKSIILRNPVRPSWAAHRPQRPSKADDPWLETRATREPRSTRYQVSLSEGVARQRRLSNSMLTRLSNPPRGSERDAWFDVPEARYSHRTRQQKPEQLAVGRPLNFSQPRFLSPPPNNTDIRSFIGAKRRRRNAVEPDIGHTEHAAVNIEANIAPINGLTSVPTLHPDICDFVSASELALVDSSSPPLPLYTDQQPSRQPRRRRTGERTLVDWQQ